jgi:hypothetical protein
LTTLVAGSRPTWDRYSLLPSLYPPHIRNISRKENMKESLHVKPQNRSLGIITRKQRISSGVNNILDPKDIIQSIRDHRTQSVLIELYVEPEIAS